MAAVAGSACADDLMLKNVNVVDVDAGSIIARRAVVVTDGYSASSARRNPCRLRRIPKAVVW